VSGAGHQLFESRMSKDHPQNLIHPEFTLKRSVVLVGLMGAGKTSVGRVLASRLNVGFVDSDDEIANAAGRSIPEIFAEFGEADFRDGERRVIERLLTGPPQVIATGGGAFAQDSIRSFAKEHAVTVWLDADLEVLWSRVRGREGRPLLDTADPRAVLASLLDKRRPFYSQAHLRIESSAGDQQDAVAERIVKALIEFEEKDGADA
jgi:shikimate kinase